MERPLFAIDHNFPEPLVTLLTDVLPAELVPVRKIDPSFSDIALALAKELTVLQQTQLTLVIAKGEGHNPVRATGVLLCHMAHICRQTTRAHAQIWRLSVTQKNHEDPNVFLDKIAQRSKTTAKALFEKHKLGARDLSRK